MLGFIGVFWQIVLVGRVTPGSSIQKVLVKEAKLCAAMVVVIGANKKYSFGSVFLLGTSNLGMI